MVTIRDGIGAIPSPNSIRKGRLPIDLRDCSDRNRRSDAWIARLEHLGHIDLVAPELLPVEMRELRRGTLLVASKRPKGRRTPHTNEIRKDLERLFTPALRAGREVVYSGARGKTHTLEPLDPPTLTDPVQVEGAINGKTYRGAVGVLDHTDAKVAGIWFGYQHRMIVRKGAAHISGLPSNVYGYIELGDEWRKSLTTFKDDIARDLEPLLYAVRAQIQDVIDQGLSWNKDLKVDWLTSQLRTALFASTGDGPGRVEASDGDQDRVRGVGGPSGSGGGGRSPDSIDQAGQDPRDHDAKANGITIEPDPGREPFVWTELSESRIVVSFDPDHPHFAKSLAEPLDCPAFFGAIGASFSAALAARSPEESVRIFPALRSKLTDDPNLRFAAILDEFVRRTAQVRERPTIAQIEKGVSA